MEEDTDPGDLGSGGPGAGVMYHRPPPKKKKSVSKAPAPPTTLADLDSEAKVVQQRRIHSKSGSPPVDSGGLAKISEAAEWADESSRIQVSLDDEFDELWAQVGVAPVEAAASPEPSTEPSEDGSPDSTSVLLSKYGRSPGKSKPVAAPQKAVHPPSKEGVGSAAVEVATTGQSIAEDPSKQTVSPLLAAPSVGPAERRAGAVESQGRMSAGESDCETADDSSDSDAELADQAGRTAADLKLVANRGVVLPAARTPSPHRSQEQVSSLSVQTLTPTTPAGNEDNEDCFGLQLLEDSNSDVGDASPAHTAGRHVLEVQMPQRSVASSGKPSRPSSPGCSDASPEGGSDLLALMGSAIRTVERGEPIAAPANVAAPPEEPPRLLSPREEPEVAGLEDETQRVAVGEVSRFLAADVARPAGGGAGGGGGKKPFVGRSDVVDQAISKGIKDRMETGSQPPSVGGGAAHVGPSVLAGLRKAYESGGARGSPDSGNASTRPPEEPPEDDDEDVTTFSDVKRGCAAELAVMDDEQDLEAVVEEWDEIEARTDEIRAREEQDRGRIRSQDDILQRPISWRDVQQWLLQEVVIDQTVLDHFRKEEVFETGCITCMGKRRSLLDVPGLDKKLCRDKDLVLFLKATDFDFNELTHFRMLRTIYMKLTRNKVCPTIGRHWEVMGFQHTDPRTDLNRSGGLLNVLHLFFMLSHHFEILKSAYLLAQDTEQNFPLACVSINITRMVIESLIAGRLSSLCNLSEGGVLDTICRVYAGGLYHFYSRWRALKRTIRDSEVTFNEVRRLLEKSPKRLIEGLSRGVEDFKAKHDPGKFEFTDLDFTSRAPQGEAPKSSVSFAVPRRLRNYHDSAD